MRFVLALGPLLLIWGGVGLVVACTSGRSGLPWARPEPRVEAPPADGGMASVDFSLTTITNCGLGPDDLMPSPPVAIAFTSTGALAILLALAAHRLREGPVPPPRSLRRDVLDGEHARRGVHLVGTEFRVDGVMPRGNRSSP